MTNHRILRFVPGSMVGTVVAGGNGAGILINQLNSPFGLILDVSSNSLFITNFDSANIVRWVIGASTWTLVAGTPLGTTGTSPFYLHQPSFMTVDQVGNIYVADMSNMRIQFFQPDQPNGTTIAGVTGVAGNSAQHLYNPYGIAFDKDFNLYVADTSNHRIQKFERY